jgi:hypothetical protein
MKQAVVGVMVAIGLGTGSVGGAVAASSHSVPKTGTILFGMRINKKSLSIAHPSAHFHRGAHVWYSAALVHGAASIRIVLARSVGGGSLQIVDSATRQTVDPTYNLYADTLNTAFLRPAHYVLEITAGNGVLAKGNFSITR